MAEGIEEKRLYPRIKVSSPIRYQIRGRSEFNNTLSDNISLGGVSFVDYRFIAPMTVVTLEINILSKILRPKGRIAWSCPLPHSNRYCLGVEFLELEPLEKNYLQDYIDMQLGKL